MRDGRAPVIVVPGSPPAYRFDEARAESQVARLAVDAALQRAAGRADAFTPVQQPMQTVGSRYIDWLVPGLLGMNIMGTGMWGVGFSIVQARSKKLLKRLIATPMKKTHYLLSLVLSRLATLTLEVVIIIGFAWIAFDVAVHGSIWALAALALLGALAFGGLGLFVASRARTIEAVSGLMNLVMLPMWVLSGRVLRGDELSRCDAALHSRAAADGAQRRDARDRQRRPLARHGAAADRHPRGMGQRLVCVVGEAVSLAVSLFRRLGEWHSSDCSVDETARSNASGENGFSRTGVPAAESCSDSL